VFLPENYTFKERMGMAKKILVVLSEWGYWGEELVGPLEAFDAKGYTSVFCTPTGRRPRALPPSYDPTFVDPPLGKTVTSAEMARKVQAIDDPKNPRLTGVRNLSAWFPERPYWTEQESLPVYPTNGTGPQPTAQRSSSPLRKWEYYYGERAKRQREAAEEFDALLLVGGSGPMVDMVNNYRVHDLILGFRDVEKPVAAECYGVACLAQARDFQDAKSIIWGKHVTGHAKEYDYKDLTGVLDPETGQILTRQSGNWVNLGPPFYTLEYMLRDATGPEGGFHGNVGHAVSVIVDYPYITGRSTPDSHATGDLLVRVLEDKTFRRYGW
jgi:putative intracellular protease/amidase